MTERSGYSRNLLTISTSSPRVNFLLQKRWELLGRAVDLPVDEFRVWQGFKRDVCRPVGESVLHRALPRLFRRVCSSKVE